MSLVCGALAGCAHDPPSVAQLIDSGKDGQALALVRESKGAPAIDSTAVRMRITNPFRCT